MNDDQAPKKPAATGLPPWVMTFADLMSLLMCFFVLLLSFSEMDVSKYKQIAGSMKEAFGVQRVYSVKEPPKGINIIAQEFSAGRPAPTPLNVLEQITTDEMKMYLEAGEKRRKPGDGGPQGQGEKEALAGRHDGGEKQLAQAKNEAQDDASKAQAAKSEAGKEAEQQADDTGGKPADAEDEQLVMLPKEDALRALKARQEEAAKERLEQSAKRIRSALRWEIKDGAVDVETEEQKIIIRIREKASFPSGQAGLRESFRPILQRVGKILNETEGRIIISGHTDNIPISTDRFRSNWELSAARAVSVVHDLIDLAGVDGDRFLVEGLADTQPIVPNDGWENRSMNRRVEIKLVQGEDLVAKGELNAAPPPKLTAPAEPNTEGAAEPAIMPSGQPPAGSPKVGDPFINESG